MKIVTFIVIACFIFIILFINILIMKGDLPMGAPMKNSRQRNAILECVMRHHDHPTADIIYQELRESFPNISLGTVYRNLSLLTSLGKIMKITCENHVLTDRQNLMLILNVSPAAACRIFLLNHRFIHRKKSERDLMELSLIIQ